MICRPTQEEAQAEWDRQLNNADVVAVDNLMSLMFAHAQSFPKEVQQSIREVMSVGHGGFPLLGTPEHVAQGIIDLHKAGDRKSVV